MSLAMRTLTAVVLIGWTFLACKSLVQSDEPGTKVPTLYIIGDSTVKNSTKGQQGWGDPLASLFDSKKIKVANRAIGGRSSRTFLTERRWDAIVKELKPGDFVLMQFGHNDSGSLTGTRHALRSKAMATRPRKSLMKRQEKPRLYTALAGICVNMPPILRPKRQPRLSYRLCRGIYGKTTR